MNTKIVMSALSILGALTIMGGATYAAFSSDATNPNNTFAAGDMTLEINGAAGSGSTAAFTVADIAPGESKTQVLSLTNSGSVDSVSTKLASITHSSNAPFDLGDKLTLELWDDVDNSGTIGGSDVLRGSAHVNDAAWTNIDLGFGLGPDHNVIARVTFDADASNDYQGAQSTFSLNFTTTQ